MKIYLGLGSNLSDRKGLLEQAILKLKELLNASSIRVSPAYETPALLPAGADPTWNKPFLNLVVELESDVSPEELLKATQFIEQEAGRTRHSKWAPRELDIDILLYGRSNIHKNDLTIPHPEISKRAFVLDALKDLNPNIQLFGKDESVLSLARRHTQHAPVWMGILNITPDSFSDGGRFNCEESIQKEIQYLDDQNIGIIDIGGESTRPGAISLPSEQEWERVKTALQLLRAQFKRRHIRPMISLDTRHFETALKAIEYGIDILNDISGLEDKRFVNLIKNSDCLYILTHSLGVPANTNHVISQNIDVMDELKKWFSEKIDFLTSQGVKTEKIILDPGIGFGKTALQSQTILQNIDKLFCFNLRLLVGHSRKSFLAPFSSAPPQERDLESVGVSLAMVGKGVDILRVHNPIAHMRAFQGWNHVHNSP